MTLSIGVDDLPRLLVMLVLAALLGWVADLFTGGRVPLGFFGSILFGLLGAWVAADLVRPRLPLSSLPKEPALDGSSSTGTCPLLRVAHITADVDSRGTDESARAAGAGFRYHRSQR